MAELYEDLCVTHGIENVLHMTQFVENKLTASIETLRDNE